MAHPEPPKDLDTRKPLLVDVASPAFRLHAAGLSCLYFGYERRYRFDDPLGEFGVLYAGQDEHCAFIESYGHPPGHNLVTSSELRSRELCRLEFGRSLRLIDLTGPGLARIGATEELCSGDRGVAKRWSRALYDHPTGADGLLYRARHDPSRTCLALYDRAANAVRAMELGNLMEPEHRALLGDILDSYAYGFRDTPG